MCFNDENNGLNVWWQLFVAEFEFNWCDANGLFVKINRPTDIHSQIHTLMRFQTFLLTRSLTHAPVSNVLCLSSRGRIQKFLFLMRTCKCICARAHSCSGIWFCTPPPLVSFSLFWDWTGLDQFVAPSVCDSLMWCLNHKKYSKFYLM